MRQSNAIFFFLLIISMVAFATISSAATINLIDSFGANTDDEIVRFGDQTESHFVDTTPDYNNISYVGGLTFTVSDLPSAGTVATLSMEHYGARPDLGYYSFFTINGYNFTSLALSGEGTGLPGTWATKNHDYNDDGTVDWTLHQWGISVDLLNLALGNNNLAFTVGTVNGNQNEVEIRNFTLTYTAEPGSPVPEPGSMVLMAIGLLGLARIGRNRQ